MCLEMLVVARAVAFVWPAVTAQPVQLDHWQYLRAPLQVESARRLVSVPGVAEALAKPVDLCLLWVARASVMEVLVGL